MAPDF